MAQREAILAGVSTRIKKLIERQAELAAMTAGELARQAGVVLETIDATPAQLAVVRATMRWLGVPYVWGGASPSGFDCSGLVIYVYAQFGVALPHGATMQSRLGDPVSLDRLQPADLVFFGSPAFYSHVGMYVGGGLFIEAPAHRRRGQGQPCSPAAAATSPAATTSACPEPRPTPHAGRAKAGRPVDAVCDAAHDVDSAHGRMGAARHRTRQPRADHRGVRVPGLLRLPPRPRPDSGSRARTDPSPASSPSKAAVATEHATDGGDPRRGRSPRASRAFSRACGACRWRSTPGRRPWTRTAGSRSTSVDGRDGGGAGLQGDPPRRPCSSARRPRCRGPRKDRSR